MATPTRPSTTPLTQVPAAQPARRFHRSRCSSHSQKATSAAQRSAPSTSKWAASQRDQVVPRPAHHPIRAAWLPQQARSLARRLRPSALRPSRAIIARRRGPCPRSRSLGDETLRRLVLHTLGDRQPPLLPPQRGRGTTDHLPNPKPRRSPPHESAVLRPTAGGPRCAALRRVEALEHGRLDEPQDVTVTPEHTERRPRPRPRAPVFLALSSPHLPNIEGGLRAHRTASPCRDASRPTAKHYLKERAFGRPGSRARMGSACWTRPSITTTGARGSWASRPGSAGTRTGSRRPLARKQPWLLSPLRLRTPIMFSR